VELVALSEDTLLDAGQTTILVCVGSGDTISWRFNGAPVANTSLVTTYEQEVIKGGRVFKQSHLQICAATESVAGEYTCTVRNGITVVEATTQVHG
jgi:hypothetical protein